MGTSRTRALLSATAAILAAVVLPVALLSTWVSADVTDSDRYVATVTPLADDPVVQNATIDHLTDAAVDLIKSEGAATGVCDDHVSAPAQTADPNDLLGAVIGSIGQIASAVAPLLKDQIRGVVTSIVHSESFKTAWVAGNRSAHDQLVGILRGDNTLVDKDGCVSIELGTLLNSVGSALDANGVLPITLPEVRTSFAVVKAGDLRSARVSYKVLNGAGAWLLLVWIALAAAALLLAADRRLGLRWLSGGALAAMAVLSVILALARHGLTSGTADAAVGGRIWDVLTADLGAARTVVALVAVIGIVWSFVLPERGEPEDRPSDGLAVMLGGLDAAVVRWALTVALGIGAVIAVLVR
ncbi:MAG TPA: hypothetical protein VFE15_08310 [Marmoricola sp.]|nr:hypothetical protein [Marmoricola sp.]